MLQRLVGFDVIIFPGFGQCMKTTGGQVQESVQECLTPQGNLKRSLPVPAGSQWAGSTTHLHEKLGTIDFGIVPGRAVFEYPMGPRAGAASLRQGWEAAASGKTLTAYARDHPELARAIKAFGS